MQNKTHLATLALISAAGLILILAGLRTGSSDIASALFATPVPVPVYRDSEISPDALSLQAPPAVTLVQRVQTITLEMMPADIMSSTWPVRQEELEINSPGGDWPLPVDAWDISAGIPTGTVELTRTNGITPTLIIPGTPEWVTITYHTRQRVVRSGPLVTVVGKASISQGVYEPLTSTIVYTRPFPPKAESDYWGHTYAQLQSVSPITTDKSPVEGWLRWVTTTSSFSGSVTLKDPLFGSDLTVTKFLMYPPPAFGRMTSFTVTITNIGTVTASRRFATELYVKPISDTPPKDAADHSWGIITYQGDALFHYPDQPGNWPVRDLGPGQSITLATAITLTSATDAGDYKAYAQVDTFYQGDASEFYAWYGSNAEGNGIPPYPEENNVSTLRQTFYISATYRLDAWFNNSNLKAPPGRKAIYLLNVQNTGNLTDTYDITATFGTFTVTVPPTSIGPVRNNNMLSPTQRVTVTTNCAAVHDPPTSDTATITISSHNDPSQSVILPILTTCDWYRIYLPVVRKQK